MGRVLDEALASLSPVTVFERVIIPVQREVGDRWHRKELSVAQEHLVTHALRSRLLSLIQGAAEGSLGHVVCACFPDEDHEFGLLGVALRFRQAGFRVTYLGARTPLAELIDLARKLKVDRVALSQVTPVNKKDLRKHLSGLREALAKGTQVLVGGAGAEPHAELIHALGGTMVPADGWARVLA